jgi:hypothetical protein
MQATKKAPAIDALLTSITGRSRVESVADNICNFCGKPVGKFFDRISEKEYTISGMCQKCQDFTFKE